MEESKPLPVSIETIVNELMQGNDYMIPVSHVPNANRLRLSLKYDKGGLSAYKDHSMPRGFYLSVRPEKVEGAIYGFDAYSGYRNFVSPKPIGRISEKAKLLCQDNVTSFARLFLDKYTIAYTD